MLFNVALPGHAGKYCTETGMDSLEWCQQNNASLAQERVKYFLQYPHKIEYQYNARGFRDHEWPQDHELENAIWCLGDSFTVGIGSPFEHAWPQVLSQRLGQRIINVSMNGASNEWIARMSEYIFKELQPSNMIIMWSYIHRRNGVPQLDQAQMQRCELTGGADQYWKNFYNELKLSHWPEAPSLADFAQLPLYIRQELRDIHVVDWLHVSQDLEEAYISDSYTRRIHAEATQHEDDVQNTVQCMNRVLAACQSSNVVQAMIPKFAPSHYVSNVLSRLRNIDSGLQYIDRSLDWARDQHHFGVKTSNWFVDQFVPMLK